MFICHLQFLKTAVWQVLFPILLRIVSHKGSTRLTACSSTRCPLRTTSSRPTRNSRHQYTRIPARGKSHPDCYRQEHTRKGHSRGCSTDMSNTDNSETHPWRGRD